MALEYEAYRQWGGRLPEADFLRLELRARNELDRLTHGRLRGEEPLRAAAQMAAFALAEAMHQADVHGGGAVESLTNDGISVRYAVPEDARAQYARIVREYLSGEKTASGTGLLYAGVDA